MSRPHHTPFSNAAGSDAAAYTRALLELLGDRDPFDVQRQTVHALHARIDGLDEARLRTPEAPGKWSVLHVLGHLADTDLVYGYRMRMIVAQPGTPIAGYDQDAWAERLGYGEADPLQVLERLATLRRDNLAFLGCLTPAQWDCIGVHSERGEESIRLIFALLAAHDLVHLRQIDRILAAV